MSEFTFIPFTCFQPIISTCQDIFESRFCHPFYQQSLWLCVNCRFDKCVFCSASSKVLRRTRSRAEPWGVVGDACWLAPGIPCCFFSARASRQATLSFPVRDPEALTDIFLELPHHSHCQRHTPQPPSPPPSPCPPRTGIQSSMAHPR